MSTLQWFSTKVRLVALLSSGGSTGYRDSIFLLRADDFVGALEKALKIGRAQERSYTNADGDTLRWALVSIVSLDALGAELREGTEVYSEPLAIDAEDVHSSETVFRPELSEPVQTV